jgi:hypothetical protein
MSQIWPLMNNSDHLLPRVNTHTLLITMPLFQSASWEVCAKRSVHSTAVPSPRANAVSDRRCQLVSTYSLWGGGGGNRAEERALVKVFFLPRHTRRLPSCRTLDFCLIAFINFASVWSLRERHKTSYSKLICVKHF